MFQQAEADLVIAVPTRGNVRCEWAAMLRGLSMPPNLSYAIQMIPNRTVEEARNVAVQKARELHSHYILFIDDDVLMPNQGVQRMVFKMEQETQWDMLTGIVPLKTDPPQPCVFRGHRPGPYWGWTFGEYFEVDSCGLACCLIRMEAFDKVKGDPFTWTYTHDGLTGGQTGEDIGFCMKLAEAGGRILADGALLCGHIDTKGKVYMLDIDAAPFHRAGKDTLAKYKIMDQRAEKVGAIG